MHYAATSELTIAIVMYNYETTGLWAQTCQSNLHLVRQHFADQPDCSGAAVGGKTAAEFQYLTLEMKISLTEPCDFPKRNAPDPSDVSLPVRSRQVISPRLHNYVFTIIWKWKYLHEMSVTCWYDLHCTHLHESWQMLFLPDMSSAPGAAGAAAAATVSPPVDSGRSTQYKPNHTRSE